MNSIHDAHKEFSSRLGSIGPVVIAGGAVRDTLLKRKPKDFDVFLLGVEKPEQVEGTITMAMGGLAVLEPLEFHKSEPYLVGSWDWNGTMVQVMGSPAKSTDELLDGFDWNVCLFAYDGRYHKREYISNIAPGKSLRLQTVRFPASTLRRGFRFSERFAMKLERQDVLSLCEKVVALGAKPGSQGAEPDMPALAANALVGDRP